MSEAEKLADTIMQLPITDFFCMQILLVTMAHGREAAAEMKKHCPGLKARYTEILTIGNEEDARRYAW